MIFLILGPVLNLAATFFWQDGRQGATSGALSGLGIALWLIGLLSLYDGLRPRSPRFVAAAVPLTVLGAAGGVAFSVQSIHEEMFGVTHAATVDRLTDFPLAANTLFWLCGPLFPMMMVALGIMLIRLRTAPAAIGVLLILGGLAFPLSRITRETLIVHLADLLLCLPFLYLAVRPPRPAAPETASTARSSSRA
ncbi:hypothetical protein AB0M54_06385 [Actinoplanes sp. NPDC051470]|uniref:hypothetical protein n=1 Tax=unclassified Actinoplanes TaxID=2626549 RepID=UPI003434D719